MVVVNSPTAILVQTDSTMFYNANGGRSTILDIIPLKYQYTSTGGVAQTIWRKSQDIGESVFIGHSQNINLLLTDPLGNPLDMTKFICFVTFRAISI
jgi:hypothetical protein